MGRWRPRSRDGRRRLSTWNIPWWRWTTLRTIPTTISRRSTVKQPPPQPRQAVSDLVVPCSKRRQRKATPEHLAEPRCVEVLSRNHRRIPRRNRNTKRRRRKRRKRHQHLHQLRNRHTPSTGDHPQLKIPTKSLKKNPLKRSHLMKNNFVETSLKMLGELCLIRKVIFNHELGRWNQRLCYRCRKNEKR